MVIDKNIMHAVVPTHWHNMLFPKFYYARAASLCLRRATGVCGLKGSQ